MSKLTDAQYAEYDPFEGGDRDVEIKCREVRMVTTRKPHTCIGFYEGVHDLPSGSRARFEKALVDGEWGSYYLCVPCMDRYLDECGCFDPNASEYEEDTCETCGGYECERCPEPTTQGGSRG